MDEILSGLVGGDGCAPDGTASAGNPLGGMVNMVFEGGGAAGDAAMQGEQP